MNVTCGHSGQHCPLGDPSLAAVSCLGQDVGLCGVLQCLGDAVVLGCPQEVTGLGDPAHPSPSWDTGAVQHQNAASGLLGKKKVLHPGFPFVCFVLAFSFLNKNSGFDICKLN